MATPRRQHPPRMAKDFHELIVKNLAENCPELLEKYDEETLAPVFDWASRWIRGRHSPYDELFLRYFIGATMANPRTKAVITDTMESFFVAQWRAEEERERSRRG